MSITVSPTDASCIFSNAEAKAFRKWVTSEVLPSIRKAGRFEAAPSTGMDMLREMARNVPIRSAQRVQMMSLAVRVCREEGCCTEAAVLSRYVSLCDVVAEPQRHDPALVHMAAMSDLAGLVGAFADEALIVTPGTAPESRTRGGRLYESFTEWCAARGVPEAQTPSHARFGMAIKAYPGVKRCPPADVVNYNVVIRPEVTDSMDNI